MNAQPYCPECGALVVEAHLDLQTPVKSGKRIGSGMPRLVPCGHVTNPISWEAPLAAPDRSPQTSVDRLRTALFRHGDSNVRVSREALAVAVALADQRLADVDGMKQAKQDAPPGVPAEDINSVPPAT